MSARPAEDAAVAAQQAQHAQTLSDLGGDLHHTEVMAAHQGSPSVAVQSATHGAPAPQPDHGTDDRAKLQNL